MVCEVMLELKAKNLQQSFTYLVPDSLTDTIRVGQRVEVPFGKRKIAGFVVALKPFAETNFKLKPIIAIIDQQVILNEEIKGLITFISDSTLTSPQKVTETVLPKGLQAKINHLKRKQIILVKLLVDGNELIDYIKNNRLGINQKACLEALENGEEVPKSRYSSSTYDRLLNDKVIEFLSIDNKTLDNKVNHYPSHKLNLEQEKVCQEITKSFNKNEIFLLHGVTGSGKTEVYLQLIEEILKQNKTAIVLVPEISLTPQIELRFKGRFQSGVILLHSKMNNQERLEAWERIKSGEIKVAIGPRSAIFAPFDNLGLIIIDEEHESSYKQQNNPRYHVLDVAKYRSDYHQIPIVLGSATPSLESMARAKKGVYKLLEIKERVNKNLPEVIIVDKNKSNNPGLFTKELMNAINIRLQKKEQIILLLNRRGFNTLNSCISCGYTFKCPDCDIPLTYHLTGNSLKCHYCGYSEPAISVCPKCYEPAVRRLGMGTQRLELELKEQFKAAKIIRMDQDSTSKKGSHHQIINDFSNQLADILLGTQMIAKGLDFSNVTLVGVINADSSLNIPDFRSAERTFQLLSQVAGRSGRSEIAGEVIIETFNPDHYVMQSVKNHDYEKFYLEEMNIRKILHYPPYFYLATLKVSSTNEELLTKELLNIKIADSKNYEVLGPSSIIKISNNYSFRYIIKYKDVNLIRPLLNDLIKAYSSNQKINIDVDFNPMSL